MSFEVKKIFLSSQFTPKSPNENPTENTDVIVWLTNGDKYVASFFTFMKLEKLQRLHSKTGDFMGGKYFWEKNMLLIDDVEESNIKSVVYHLIQEGDFLSVFEKI